MSGPMALRLLEGFALVEGARTLQVPLGAQRLLALLAERGASQRSTLAGSLWPDVPEAQALGNLRTLAWRVNKVHPDVLLSGGNCLSLSPRLPVDSHAQARAAALVLGGAAVDADELVALLPPLWHGALLPGWYDDWVIFERERLTQLRLHALERAAAAMIEVHRLDLALRLALESVHVDPLRETANHALISVYLAEGNLGDALHQYRVFRRLLSTELGLKPSPRLAGLVAQLTTDSR